MTKVFISYSHDSDAHRERVLGLSERLRADGIETILDRYVERGSPPEGWPRWMLQRMCCAYAPEPTTAVFAVMNNPAKAKGWIGKAR